MKITLKQLREESGMTQEEVADALEIKDPRTYRRYEYGELTIRGDKLQDAAQLFGVHADDIILVRKKRVK